MVDSPFSSLVQRLDLPYAVFDLHFHPREKDKFAIASSTGAVALFNLSRGQNQTSITPIWTKQVHEDPSIPTLFLAWTPDSWLPRPVSDGFAVTFSDSLTVVFGTNGALTDEAGFTELGSFHARQMIEVWFVALSTAKQSIENSAQNNVPFMYTGDDFGSLHTRRFGNDETQIDEDEPLSPPLLDHDDRARHHTAGVTSILPLPIPMADDAPILLTGSYDESLRVYHATRRGEVLAEQGLGGGVWRLQLIDSKDKTLDSSDSDLAIERTFLVLASCMHAGTRVVRVTQTQHDQGSEWDIQVLAEFTEHESMNYASDVRKGVKSDRTETSSGKSELLCVSSSFYDRRLCVWKINV